LDKRFRKCISGQRPIKESISAGTSGAMADSA